ncbi:MAG TPA: ATP-binding protein [Oculatellaceae cyanobacterium]|jgi:PAS domain S-box-containing protein
MSAELLNDQMNESNLSVKLLGVDSNQEYAQLQSHPRLPLSLSSLETWGFGMSGLLLWLGTGPGMHADLGTQAIWVWLPSAIVGMLINFQAKSLGTKWPQVSGGTANYTARLLNNYPVLARIAPIGYFVGWSSVPAINAIILTHLIQTTLSNIGLTCPETLLKITFTLLPFILAFSGTRALGILHLCFVIPALGFLLLFCLQGLGWLAFAPASPGLLPDTWSSFSFPGWAKWYFIAVYAIYDCETAASFVAESKRPATTLQCLPFVAWLIPPIYLGGSWLLMQLATQPGMGDDTFLNLLAAAKPFWGQSASWLVTLLIVCSCLLSSATAVSNCPRILYQLSLDGYLAPVFSVVSRQGVLGPALTFNLLIGASYLIWGDIAQILTVTGTGYLSFSILFHLALWLGRDQPAVKWPWLSLGFFMVELVVLVVGGLAWSWKDLLMGLLLMPGILLIDTAIRRIPFPPFQAAWWMQLYRPKSQGKAPDFMIRQVVVLICLICSTTTIGWLAGYYIEGSRNNSNTNNLFVVLLVTIAFMGVAIATWTSLPQVTALDQAREQAENLFITALDTVPDTILVVDEQGIINQANPAAEQLFGINNSNLLNHYLNEYLSGLVNQPSQWSYHSEQTLNNHHGLRIIETTISQRSKPSLREYIVILRDITERKLAEAQLQQTLQVKDELATQAINQAQELETTLKELQKTQTQLIQTEKMSSLGQLVAGVAHEINNPVNFIHGNLAHVSNYSQDLLDLIALYQEQYSNPIIQKHIEEIDLNYLIEDLPKTLSSMKVGTDRIRQIVLTLRNFSRLDEADKKPVNIHEGIESTFLILQNNLKGKAGEPEIEIIKEYADLPKIECYAGQLNQVFMNILSNAIHALRIEIEGKKIAAPSIRINTQLVDEKWVVIKIKDNGFGMNETVRARLFDPFFTTKSVGEGTGLGLSISYQIVVDKHGGNLECISSPGEGAEFLIKIPLKKY